MAFRLVAMWGVSLMLAGTAVSQEAKPDPREDLKTAIPTAIELLEKKEYEKFLRMYVPPEVFARITEDKTIEEFARRFGERKADRLLTALRELKDVKPEMGRDRKTATFQLKNEIAGKATLSFQKIEKYWYIKDK